MPILSSQISILAVLVVASVTGPGMEQSQTEALTGRAGQSVAVVTGSTEPVSVTSDAKRGKISLAEQRRTRAVIHRNLCDVERIVDVEHRQQR